jgi:opacity protein-like surface antigen
MKKVSVIAALAIVMVIFSGTTHAQSLEKRHQIGLRVGMWNQTTGTRTEIGAGTVTTSVGNNGAMGSVFYGHWLQENLALDISVGGMLADVESSAGITGVTSETAVIGRILLGVKYYFLKSTYNSSVRPFVNASLGLFNGSQTTSEVGWVIVTESRTESAFGGQLGGGLDFVLSRHFMLGLALGYNLMTDFKEPIGGSKNYSGPEFGIGLSYLFAKA